MLLFLLSVKQTYLIRFCKPCLLEFLLTTVLDMVTSFFLLFLSLAVLLFLSFGWKQLFFVLSSGFWSTLKLSVAVLKLSLKLCVL